MPMRPAAAGAEFDRPCVEALLRARLKGSVLTQRERESSAVSSQPSALVGSTNV
jgi:hypothetical protein